MRMALMKSVEITPSTYRKKVEAEKDNNTAEALSRDESDVKSTSKKSRTARRKQNKRALFASRELASE